MYLTILRLQSKGLKRLLRIKEYEKIIIAEIQQAILFTNKHFVFFLNIEGKEHLSFFSCYYKNNIIKIIITIVNTKTMDD